MKFNLIIISVVCNNGAPVSSTSEKIEFGTSEGRDRFVADITRVNEENQRNALEGQQKYTNSVNIHHATLAYDSAV